MDQIGNDIASEFFGQEVTAVFAGNIIPGTIEAYDKNLGVAKFRPTKKDPQSEKEIIFLLPLAQVNFITNNKVMVPQQPVMLKMPPGSQLPPEFLKGLPGNGGLR